MAPLRHLSRPPQVFWVLTCCLSRLSFFWCADTGPAPGLGYDHGHAGSVHLARWRSVGHRRKPLLEGGQSCPQPAFSRLWPPKKAAAAKIGRPPRVFIIFGGPQGDDDRLVARLVACSGLAGRPTRAARHIHAPLWPQSVSHSHARACPHLPENNRKPPIARLKSRRRRATVTSGEQNSGCRPVRHQATEA